MARPRFLWLLATAVPLLVVAPLGAQPLEPAIETAGEAEDEKHGRGPGTLLQWSRGNSFSGGPDRDEPLVTDRPDFTEASVTVGRRVLQIEMGYSYFFDDEAVNQSIVHSYPETLLRYGFLAEWLEFRLAWSYQQNVVNDTADAQDIYTGLKLALTPQEGFLPEMAIVPQMFIPTATRPEGGREVLPGLNWLYGWDINDWLSMGGSTQFNHAVDPGSGRTFTEFAQSWTINYTLAERLTGYTEWFAFFPHAAETAKPEYYFDGGLAVLLTDNLQWDIRAGIGLNDESDDYFAGTGLSVRIK